MAVHSAEKPMYETQDTRMMAFHQSAESFPVALCGSKHQLFIVAHGHDNPIKHLKGRKLADSRQRNWGRERRSPSLKRQLDCLSENGRSTGMQASFS